MIRALCLALLGLTLLGTNCAQAQTMSLQVYFNNAVRAGTSDDCAIVHPRTRSVPRTLAVATTALRALFAGPTEEERAKGYRSPFSTGTSDLLRRVRVHAGTGYVDLHDRRDQLRNVVSSCGTAEFHSQIESTLRQFPTVQRMILAIEGSPADFYHWMEQECDQANDFCDPSPFD